MVPANAAAPLLAKPGVMLPVEPARNRAVALVVIRLEVGAIVTGAKNDVVLLISLTTLPAPCGADWVD